VLSLTGTTVMSGFAEVGGERDAAVMGPSPPAPPAPSVCFQVRDEGGEVPDAAAGVDPARWLAVLVAVVGIGAAGVNESLLRSGSSSDLRRRGEPGRPVDGDVGFEDWGEI